MSFLSRRTFGKGTALAGASFLIHGTRASGNVKGANDRIRIAVAGLNGRGKSHISGWLSQPNVEIAYLIDPDQMVLERAMRDLEKKTDGKLHAKGFRMFERRWRIRLWTRFPLPLQIIGTP